MSVSKHISHSPLQVRRLTGVWGSRSWWQGSVKFWQQPVVEDRIIHNHLLEYRLQRQVLLKQKTSCGFVNTLPWKPNDSYLLEKTCFIFCCGIWTWINTYKCIRIGSASFRYTGSFHHSPADRPTQSHDIAGHWHRSQCGFRAEHLSGEPSQATKCGERNYLYLWGEVN